MSRLTYGISTFTTHWRPAPLRLLIRRRRASGIRVLTEHLPRSLSTDPSIPVDPAAVVRQPRPGAYLGKTLFKRLEFALTDAVITPSTGAAEFIDRRYHRKRGATTMVHNGVPVPVDPAPPISCEPMEVLLVGAFAHRKGQDVLLDAAGRAAEGWNVTFVGEGATRPGLELAASRLIDRRVRFVGWRSDAAKAPIECHVACVPSRMESFSYVALEAMACARPVVASSIDGLSEIVEDGVSGHLVPPDDPTALAQVLDSLAADPANRQRMDLPHMLERANDSSRDHDHHHARLLSPTVQNVTNDLPGAARSSYAGSAGAQPARPKVGRMN